MAESAQRAPLEDADRDIGIFTPRPQPLSTISSQLSQIWTLHGSQQPAERMKAIGDFVRTCAFRQDRLERRLGALSLQYAKSAGKLIYCVRIQEMHMGHMCMSWCVNSVDIAR